MTLAAIILIIIAAAVGTRLGKLLLARWLLWAGLVIGEAGGRVLAAAKRQGDQ